MYFVHPYPRLNVHCALNGDLTVRLTARNGEWRFSAFPWLIPLPDLAVPWLQAWLPDRLPVELRDLLYCELARVVSGRLVIDADHLPLDAQGCFPPCSHLRLARAEYDPQTGRRRTIFTVWR